MDALFPLGLPPATAFYAVLLVATLAVHALFLSYVLAGSLYLAWTSLLRLLQPARPVSVAADRIRDWLPFALSAAITAGVAPLLFVQVLYQEAFYTANLLLFHRWMAILPALVVGFYLLYVLKARPARRRPGLRLLVAAGAAACFLYTAWSWTGNHLLSLDREAWIAFYREDRWFHRDPTLLPRLLFWVAGSFPVLAALVAWQVLGRWRLPPDDARHIPPAAATEALRHLARLALLGMAVAAAAALLWTRQATPAARQVLAGPAGAPGLGVAGGGILLQLAGWLPALRGRLPGRTSGLLRGIGLALALGGVAAARETLRLAAVDLAALAPLHARALESGGFPVFVLFLVLNAAAGGGAVVLARRARRRG